MSVRLYFAAAGDLLRNYASVFSHSWRERKKRPAGFFNAQEAEFLPAALSLQECPDSASLVLTGRLLMGLVLLTILWSIFGRMDIVVNATGKIIPATRTKTIASVELASVRELYVTEGQAVRAGDVLIELDSSTSDAERDKASLSVELARLQVARAQSLMRAIHDGTVAQLPPVEESTPAQWRAAQQQLARQYQDFIARRARLDGEIQRYSEALPLATRRASDFLLLSNAGDVSRHAWLEKEQHRVDLAGQLEDAKNQRAALVSQVLKEANEALQEGRRALAASAQDVHRAGERSRLLRLTAPVDGTVQQLTVHTIGGVVPAAQPLMQIVPAQAHIEVEAFLENKDVGFVYVGQTAAVKIDALDYTRFGTINAVVNHVSHDAIADEKRGLIYATRIALDRDLIVVDGRALPLNPGMSVNVEIKTGTRRVIEYVLSPLMQHKREALNER